MVTHATTTYTIDPFWDTEYKNLNYIQEPFNDPNDVDRWLALGYQSKICGDMADMRVQQPSWNSRIIDFFAGLGWQDVGTSYYRMSSGTVMPEHQDRYSRYVELFDLQGQEHTIRRAIVFLESWKSGHYLEVMRQPYTQWSAGFCVEWTYDTPHMAANLGLEPRYTLQVTGHI